MSTMTAATLLPPTVSANNNAGKAHGRRTLTRHLKGPTALRGIQTASSPNLGQLYATQAQSASKKHPVPSLSRQTSYATLNLSTTALATIPDASESYAYDSVLRDTKMPPLTPGRSVSAAAGAGDDIAVGDTVDVPGSMSGTIRFIGTVQGRKGTFAGVELHPDFAPRGKNNGDVDG
jgi:hypothetical protein